jgi:hypothetical protein
MAHLLNIGETSQHQNLAHILSVGKHSKTKTTQSQHSQNLAKPKLSLSSIRKTWKNLAKPELGLPTGIGKTWQKQTRTPSQYWQNQNHPF